MTSHIHEPMSNMDNYRTSMNALCFSDETKARIAERLVDAAAKEQPVNIADTALRRRRLSLAAAAVAAIALVLGMGCIAYATGSLVSVQRFVTHLFGGQEPKVEIVDKIGRPVGAAQSSGGVTVSANAIIGDRTSIAVIFSITKDDGTPFDGIEPLEGGLLPLSFSEDLDVDFPLLTKIAQGTGSTGSSYFFDADPVDHAIQLVETRSYTGVDDLSLVGRTMTVHLSDLTYYDEDMGPTIIAPGDWTLTFPINYADSSIELPAGQSFELEGFYEDDSAGIREQVGRIAAHVNELAISPIALHLSYTAEEPVTWTSGESGHQSEHDAQLSNLLLSIPMSITLRDGSVVELARHTAGSISANEEVTHCETNVFFDRILDLNEVSSITIGDTTIELRAKA